MFQGILDKIKNRRDVEVIERRRDGLGYRIARSLYTNGWCPFVIATLLPLPIAAFVAAGTFALDPYLLVCVVLLMSLSWILVQIYLKCSADYASSSKVKLSRISIDGKVKNQLFFSVALVFVILYLLGIGGFSLIAFIALLLSILSLICLLLMPYSKAWHIVFSTVVLLIAMFSLSIVGVFTQTYENVEYSAGCLGLVPAIVGACAIIVRFTHVLERDGWTKRRQVVDRKGQTQVRPGLASIVFCFYVLFALGGVFWMAILAYIPFAFILAVLPLVYLSNCLTQYFESESYDPRILPTMQLVYLVTSLSMIFVGIMSRAA